MTLSAHFTDSTSYTYAESCDEPEMHKGSFVTVCHSYTLLGIKFFSRVTGQFLA
ncbi:hypothetical protein ACE6H2_006658 [Prunus campanulata]